MHKTNRRKSSNANSIGEQLFHSIEAKPALGDDNFGKETIIDIGTTEEFPQNELMLKNSVNLEYESPKRFIVGKSHQHGKGKFNTIDLRIAVKSQKPPKGSTRYHLRESSEALTTAVSSTNQLGSDTPNKPHDTKL